MLQNCGNPNLGNNRPEKLTDFIATLEQALGKKAKLSLEPLQAGDIQSTHADIDLTRRDLGFEPTAPIEVGLKRFADRFRQYYRV